MPTTTVPTDLDALDAQIAAAEAALLAAQLRWKNRPMGGVRLGDRGGRLQIDREARARTLDLSLTIQDAAIHMEDLKRQRAEVQLALATDPERIATMEATLAEAQRMLRDAETALDAARKTFASANATVKNRRERERTTREEIARATWARDSAQRLRDKEQAQRDELDLRSASPA